MAALPAVVHPVQYATRLSRWREELEAPTALRAPLPAAVLAVRWDVILVDGPRGIQLDGDDPPGRLSSIFLARELAARSADIFVHDCERAAEAAACARFLRETTPRGEIHGRALLRRWTV